MQECYNLHFRTSRNMRLSLLLLSVIPLCEIVTMFTSGHFVTRDCYDVLFRSFRHVRLLRWSLPVISSL